jgi:hypothetical protein
VFFAKLSIPKGKWNGNQSLRFLLNFPSRRENGMEKNGMEISRYAFCSTFHPEGKMEWKSVATLFAKLSIPKGKWNGKKWNGNQSLRFLLHFPSRRENGMEISRYAFCSTFFHEVMKVDFLKVEDFLSLYVYVTICFKSSK